MEQTSSAVKSIQNISRQTNLLSFKCFGRGCTFWQCWKKDLLFVAGEVRSLAQNSDIVSKQISADLGKMKEYVTTVVDQFYSLNQEISEQNVKINTIKEIVKDINQSVNTIQETMDMLLEQ